MLRDWLSRTAELQEAFHPASERVPGTEGWRGYVEYNAWGVVKELTEFADEVEFQPWKSDIGIKDKEAAIEEIVDALHFLGNLLVAIGATDAEVDATYEYKMAENFDRLIRGRSVATATVRGHDTHPIYGPDRARTDRSR